VTVTLSGNAAIRVVFAHQKWYPWDRLSRQEMRCYFDRGTLHAKVHRPFLQRHVQVTGQIVDAIAELGVASVPPFYVNLADRTDLPRSRPNVTRFGPAEIDGDKEVAAPDFVFCGWPEARFDDFDTMARRMAAATESQPSDDRAYWAGRCFNAPRMRLLELTADRPELIEAFNLEPNFDRDKIAYGNAFRLMDEQAAIYRHLIDIEGVGYSARLKVLLHARRPVLIAMHPWHEWFFRYMEPFRHYVPVSRDLSDLVERIEWLRAYPAREAEIAREGQRFAQTRLTRAAAVREWARLIKAHIDAGGNLTSGREHLPKTATSMPYT